MNNIKKISHRGLPSNCVENTLEAIVEKFNHNWDGVEFDVQLTKDNKVVIHHDEDLKRIYGLNVMIEDTNYQDLLELTDPPIASLEDVLMEFSNRDKIEDKLENYLIDVELKGSKCSKVKKLYNETIKLIHNFNCYSNTIITSFVDVDEIDYYKIYEIPSPPCIKSDIIINWIEYVDKEYIEHYSKYTKKIGIYTITNKDTFLIDLAHQYPNIEFYLITDVLLKNKC